MNDIFDNLNQNPGGVWEIGRSALIDLAPDLLQFCNARVQEEVLVKIWTEGTEEEAKAFLESAYNGLLARLPEDGSGLKIAAGDSEEEVVEAWTRAAKRIAEEWSK